MQFIGIGRFFHGIAVSNKWGGVSQINSGDASAVVSASNVRSGFPIFVSGQGSGSPMHELRVDSIVNNVSFAVRVGSGTATAQVPFSWIALR